MNGNSACHLIEQRLKNVVVEPIDQAKAAAPYVHPRLTAVDGRMDLRMSHEEMLQLLE